MDRAVFDSTALKTAAGVALPGGQSLFITNNISYKEYSNYFIIVEPNSPGHIYIIHVQVYDRLHL